MPQEGDLRVWHVPQIPMEAFYVNVDSVEEGLFILEILSEYDLFQLCKNVKPDYSNCNGLQEFDGLEWCDWYSEDGLELEEYAVEINYQYGNSYWDTKEKDLKKLFLEGLD